MDTVTRAIEALRSLDVDGITAYLESITLPTHVTVRQKQHLASRIITHDGGPLLVLYQPDKHTCILLEEIPLPSYFFDSVFMADQPSVEHDGEWNVFTNRIHLKMWTRVDGSYNFRTTSFLDNSSLRVIEWIESGYQLFDAGDHEFSPFRENMTVSRVLGRLFIAMAKPEDADTRLTCPTLLTRAHTLEQKVASIKNRLYSTYPTIHIATSCWLD